MPSDCYFLLQFNLIFTYFLLVSSEGCPNHSFQCLEPQGTCNQGGQANLAKMHLLTKSSTWHRSFPTSLYLFVKKDISSFQQYLSFLHNFYHYYIITIPTLFYELKTWFPMLEKLNWFCLTVAIDAIMDGSVLEEKSSLKILKLVLLLNWIGALALSLLLKLPPRKLEFWFIL